MPKAAEAGIDNTARRKWDREEFEARAQERAQEEEEEEEERGNRHRRPREPAVQRQPLKQREYDVDLRSRLGKTQVVTQLAPLSQQAGFHCPVCECIVKDSANYLDHINGKKHQRALGMSMRVERSTVDQVKSRLEMLKRKPESVPAEDDFDSRIRAQEEEEEERKRQRREKKKEKKKEKEVADEAAPPGEMDPEMAAMMGFGGFGTSKKS